MRILLVEDDENIIGLVTAVLSEQNYIVDVATDGESGWELIEAFPYDLVLLDIVLPRLDGIALCRRLRNRKKQVLVMLLTAQDTTTDKLLGLDAGADDYVVKPFDVRELAARIRALLRRGNTITEPILSCGNLQLDPSACEVTYNGRVLRFSRKEYLLLELFLRHQHRVFSRSAIVDQIWSFNEDPPNEDTVKSHIKSIRRKLDAVGAGNLIETLYGQGYRINPSYLSEALSQASLADQASDHEQPAQQQLKTVVAEIWQRTKNTSLERVRVLSAAVDALRAESLHRDLQQQAVQNAHKLAGSLGTFGFETESRLARNIENLLISKLDKLSAATQRQTVVRIEPLVAELKHRLEQSNLEQEQSQISSTDHALGATTTGVTATGATATGATATIATATIASADAAASLNQLPQLLICDAEVDLANAIAAQTAEKIRTIVTTNLQMAQSQCLQNHPDAILINLALLQGDQDKQFFSSWQDKSTGPLLIMSADNSIKSRLEAVHFGANLFLNYSTTAILPVLEQLLAPSQQPPIKILLVDDDPTLLSGLIPYLTTQNIQATGLEDPTQFWQTLNAVNPDLLILDVNMPDINGIELCQIVRADLQWRSLPIIFLTAQVDTQTQQRIFSAGADDLIYKPFNSSELSIRLANRLTRLQHRD